jgi:MoxR-like ATPase
MANDEKETRKAQESVIIEGVELFLTKPDELDIKVVGVQELQKQLRACWLTIEKGDLPLTPRLLGRPGVGKTTLAYAVGKSMSRDVYIYQCTMDTRPEDLIVTPVISDNNKIRYQASPLVTAIIKGGVCVLDEGNRMMEKAWASLAPLFDKRRYVESITAGIKIKAHPNFRCAVTMNNDSSTFEVPEYIMSRLQPQIFIDFPSRDEEKEILRINLPFAKEEMLDMMADYLRRTHDYDEPFTSRDGIHIIRYAMKLMKHTGMKKDQAIQQAIQQILGENAVGYLSPEKKQQQQYDFGQSINDLLYNSEFNIVNDREEEELEDDEFYDDDEDDDDYYYDDDDDDEYYDDDDDDDEEEDDEDEYQL